MGQAVIALPEEIFVERDIVSFEEQRGKWSEMLRIPSAIERITGIYTFRSPAEEEDVEEFLMNYNFLLPRILCFVVICSLTF